MVEDVVGQLVMDNDRFGLGVWCRSARSRPWMPYGVRVAPALILGFQLVQGDRRDLPIPQAAVDDAPGAVQLRGIAFHGRGNARLGFGLTQDPPRDIATEETAGLQALLVTDAVFA